MRIAKQTLEILEQGYYLNLNGETVNFAEEISSAVKLSRVYKIKDLDFLRGSYLDIPRKLEITYPDVTSEFAIACATRLKSEYPDQNVGCLNFASAKNVCGGMTNGSLAQEESIGTQS